MNHEQPLPARVEVLSAPSEQEPVLANLLELYAHDLSEFFDIQLQPNGRFGYPLLSRYWEEETRRPFLVKVDRAIAGFVLITRGSRISGDPQIWDVAEFFIVRRHRRRGIGASAAAEVWRRFPGPWEVRVLEGNMPARSFWRSTIDSFVDAWREEVVTDMQQKTWRLFSFQSPVCENPP
jgi:predicted acetyltransferase